MSPSLSFELDRFEYVPTSAHNVLARLHGRWRREPAESYAAPQLIAIHPQRRRRFPALDPRQAMVVAGPEPVDWQASFAVPIELIEDHAVLFALEPPEGERIELPTPQELAGGVGPAGQPGLRERRQTADRRGAFDRRSRETPPPEGVERRAADRRQSDRRRRRSQIELRLFAVRIAELETQLGAVGEAREELAQAVRSAQPDPERIASLEARAAEAERRASALEEAAAATQRRTGDLEAGLAGAGAEGAAGAAAERDELRSRLERLSAERAQLEDELQRLRAERAARSAAPPAPSQDVARLEAQLAQAQASIDALHAARERAEQAGRATAEERARLAAEVRELGATRSDAQARIAQLQAERDELARELEQVRRRSEESERQASLAREAWAESEAARQAERSGR